MLKHDGMKKALLLPNIVGFPSESMRRYAGNWLRLFEQSRTRIGLLANWSASPSRGLQKLLEGKGSETLWREDTPGLSNILR